MSGHVRNAKCHQQIAGQVFQFACAKSQCVMAQSVERDIGQISGSFNLQSVFHAGSVPLHQQEV